MGKIALVKLLGIYISLQGQLLLVYSINKYFNRFYDYFLYNAIPDH